MRISDQLIKETTKLSAIKSIQYLDLSYLNIGSIENLDACVNLKVLILKGNQIDAIDNGLEKCRQLWKLDLSHNRIKNISGLMKFFAFGSLNLSSNDLNWNELDKLRHLHILDLTLIGNQVLDKDPNYRVHLADCLPNTWILDGLLISSFERLETENYLENSKFFAKPVRRKLPRDHFTPSDMKYHSINGIYGEWTTKLFTQFPTNCTHQNIVKDKHKLEFLCAWFDELIELRSEKRKKIELNELLKYRLSNNEACNMILILLVATLNFQIPIEFIENILEFFNLKNMDNVCTIDVFSSLKPCKILVSILLLGAAKLDIDENLDASFYKHLFDALHDLIKEHLVSNDKESSSEYSYYTIVNNSRFKEAKVLLTTELLQLFSMVPAFYQYLGQDEGLENIINTCFGNVKVYNTFINMINEQKTQQKSLDDIEKEIAPVLIKLLKANAKHLLNKKNVGKTIDKSRFIEKRMRMLLKSTSQSVFTSDSVAGKQSEQTKIPRMFNIKTDWLDSIIRKLFMIYNTKGIGDHLLIGPQSMSRIVTIPQANICLIQFDYLLGLNGSMSNFGNSSDHFLYANLDYFEWDDGKKFWRPRGSTGDRITFQYNEDLFEKKLIWSMNNFTDADEMRSEMFLNLNENNQTVKDDDLSEVYSEKLPDNQSVRSKSTLSMFPKEKNMMKLNQPQVQSQPKASVYDLDVNLPSSLRTAAYLSNSRKQSKLQDTTVESTARVEKNLNSMSSDFNMKTSQNFEHEQSELGNTSVTLNQNNIVAELDEQLTSKSLNALMLKKSLEKQKKFRIKQKITARYRQTIPITPHSRPPSPSYSNLSYLQYTEDKHRKQVNIKNGSSWMAESRLMDHNKQNALNYMDKYNHIDLVMNLKSNTTRANTAPKMPNLVSPSSKEHEKYNGLRPSTARSEKLIVQTKKIELKYN